MNTFVKHPTSQSEASKALMEMYNLNMDYIQRLQEIRNLHELICKFIKVEQDPIFKDKAQYLNSLMDTGIHALNHWIDNLIDWQTSIEKTELTQHLDGLAGCIYDDYCFYETDAQHLANIAVITYQEAEKLIPVFKQGFDLEAVQYLIATIKRLALQFKADLCAETDTLPQIYPSVFKGA